jgi:oxygen-independent coproporphyrinogen III oxidase
MKLREKGLHELIQKYNVPGPRYTSYPTAVQFEELTGRVELDAVLRKRASDPKAVSLYFHIPFCFSLCWYCGCTKIITRDQDRGDSYLDYLDKEAQLVRKSLHAQSAAKQIHFGGGTPTFLTPVQLRRLGEIIRENFNVHEEVEFSVEIDPRRCTEEHIISLKEMGVNRASLGVQDTNEEVQKAIHRIQPFEQTAEVTRLLRKHGISNINFDLIYGLPLQTPESFAKTIEDVVKLDPDRFAIYSYAHIPSIMPSQKLLKEEEFPSVEQKLAMLVHAIETLPGMGYKYIGMDHFSREGDELNRALDEGTLQRNFQGYSTHAELEMIALGMSGISQGDELYYQNEKDLGRYYKALDDGELPVKKVLQLSDEDKLRRKVIMQIMCRGEINYRQFLRETGVDFREKFNSELESMRALEKDGLVEQFIGGFRITDTGRLFLRNVSMLFDGYMRERQHKTAYSKTV